MDTKTKAAGYTALGCYITLLALSAFDWEWVVYVGAGVAVTGAIALAVLIYRAAPHISDDD